LVTCVGGIVLAVGRYGLVFSVKNDSVIMERNKNSKWPNQASNSRTNTSLEEEIIRLRRQMENTVSQGNSLTSDLVVEISSLLDEKINEYMRVGKKS
jgi:hypothetical protein